jgi:cytochrome bd-type quinol oxidase subunit 2
MRLDTHAHRLPRWQLASLYVVGALLVATGVVWLGVHYAIGEGAGELPHPLEAWCLRLHGLAAFGGLFIVGALSTAHIPRGWKLTHRRRWARQRWSGIWLCAFAALLIFSGYLLYYFAPEGVRPALGWIHMIIGLSMALLVIRHRRSAPSKANT